MDQNRIVVVILGLKFDFCLKRDRTWLFAEF